MMLSLNHIPKFSVSFFSYSDLLPKTFGTRFLLTLISNFSFDFFIGWWRPWCFQWVIYIFSFKYQLILQNGLKSVSESIMLFESSDQDHDSCNVLTWALWIVIAWWNFPGNFFLFTVTFFSFFTRKNFFFFYFNW